MMSRIANWPAMPKGKPLNDVVTEVCLEMRGLNSSELEAVTGGLFAYRGLVGIQDSED